MIQIIHADEIGFIDRFDEKHDDTYSRMRSLYENRFGDYKHHQLVVMVCGDLFYVLWSKSPTNLLFGRYAMPNKKDLTFEFCRLILNEIN